MPISQEQFAQITKDLPGMGNDPRAVRMRVEALEKVLERAFHIPGTKIPVGLDTVIGLVPFLGDAFDLVWRSNTKNLKIIRKHLDKHHPSTRIIER